MQEKLQALIEKTVAGLGYIPWGHEYRLYTDSALLRVFIDTETGAGITVDDCSRVSRQLGAALDVADLITLPYALEISSPGVDRVLFKPEQYQRYINEIIKVRTHMPVAGRRNFLGTLVAVNETEISMKVEEETLSIPYENISRGRLKYVVTTVPKKGKKGGVRS